MGTAFDAGLLNVRSSGSSKWSSCGHVGNPSKMDLGPKTLKVEPAGSTWEPKTLKMELFGMLRGIQIRTLGHIGSTSSQTSIHLPI